MVDSISQTIQFKSVESVSVESSIISLLFSASDDQQLFTLDGFEKITEMFEILNNFYDTLVANVPPSYLKLTAELVLGTIGETLSVKFYH